MRYLGTFPDPRELEARQNGSIARREYSYLTRIDQYIQPAQGQTWWQKICTPTATAKQIIARNTVLAHYRETGRYLTDKQLRGTARIASSASDAGRVTQIRWCLAALFASTGLFGALARKGVGIAPHTPRELLAGRICRYIACASAVSLIKTPSIESRGHLSYKLDTVLDMDHPRPPGKPIAISGTLQKTTFIRGVINDACQAGWYGRSPGNEEIQQWEQWGGETEVMTERGNRPGKISAIRSGEHAVR